MNLFIIRALLYYEVPLVTVARNESGQHFVGVAYADGEHLFVGVPAAALDALLFAEVDLLGLMQMPDVGPVMHHQGDVAVGDTVACHRLDSIPAQALPQSGLFLTPAVQGV